MATRRINQKDYTRWVVVGGKIESGWCCTEDAQEMAKGNLPKGTEYKVLARRGLKALGLDPDDNSAWMVGPVPAPAAKVEPPKESPSSQCDENQYQTVTVPYGFSDVTIEVRVVSSPRCSKWSFRLPRTRGPIFVDVAFKHVAALTKLPERYLRSRLCQHSFSDAEYDYLNLIG